MPANKKSKNTPNGVEDIVDGAEIVCEEELTTTVTVEETTFVIPFFRMANA